MSDGWLDSFVTIVNGPKVTVVAKLSIVDLLDFPGYDSGWHTQISTRRFRITGRVAKFDKRNKPGWG